MFRLFLNILIVNIFLYVFRPTFVHHFIIQNSIEENISKMFSTNQLVDNWEDITLSQLIGVFEKHESNV